MENPITPLNLKVAIHIGASSISLLVTDTNGEQVDYLEKATSLAHDIFSKGSISRRTIEQCVSILNGYNLVLSDYGISPEHSEVRIVATNILSEASNKNIFLNRLQVGANVTVEMLDDGEMTRLIYMKTRRRLRDTVSMQESNTLVVHAGPGNTRVLFFKKGKIESYNSYRMGTHRMSESTRKNIDDKQEAYHFMSEQIQSQLDTLVEEYEHEDIKEIIFIGYEVQLISQHIQRQTNGHYKIKDIESLASDISTMADEKIVSKFNIAYHATESILPALVINATIANALNIQTSNIPNSNYEKGLLQDIHLSHSSHDSFIDEVIGSVKSLAKKFRLNKKHAKQVTRLSIQLFDDLQDLHKLDPQDRLLLHCAAYLHECGGFISPIAHHKHSLYLIMNSDIFGLSKSDILLIGIIARYHRNALPKSSHLYFADLDSAQQMRVIKIASLLRVADALDRSHTSRVSEMKISITPKQIDLHLKGIIDASVERLAMKNKGNLFQDIFGLEIILHEDK